MVVIIHSKELGIVKLKSQWTDFGNGVEGKAGNSDVKRKRHKISPENRAA